MTSAQMYELARDAIAQAAEVNPNEVEILWVGGVMENRRAVAWCGGALYAVSHNPVTGETHVDKYEKVTGNAPA